MIIIIWICFIIALSAIGWLWIANNMTLKQVMALYAFIDNAINHEIATKNYDTQKIEVYMNEIRKISYGKHLWHVITFGDWRQLYPVLGKIFDKC